MTFDDYIKNPQGKGSSAFSNKSIYKEFYTNKFNALLVRENGKILYNVYSKDDEEYFIHIKIPSEIVSNFYYDTIIRFYHKEKTGVITSTLSGYDVQFYSNDPSFVFTYAYAFKKHGLFIKDLTDKMSKIALSERAHVRNPNNDVGYVKSIYFAYLVMKRDGLFNKSFLKLKQKPYSKDVWKKTVIDADVRVKERQEAEEILKKRNKEDLKKKKRTHTTTHHKPSTRVNQSPNTKNFGHYKKADLNPIQKMSKGIGKISKNIKNSFK